MSSKKWYDGGVQFQCQGSGKCCQSRGQYGFVFMTSDDIKAAAKVLSMTTEKFKEQHCRLEEGNYALKDDPNSPDCIFLKGTSCSIYEGRPVQCRTWPFWPEVMHPKSWNKQVVEFCPGVNQGRIYSKAEIEQIMETQKASDRKLSREHIRNK